MNNKMLLILIVIIIVGGAYFMMKKTSGSPQTPTEKTPTQQTPANASNTINIKDFAFSPETITVKVGDKVTWINEDTATHNIKSETFNSPGIDQGGKYEFTFTNKGTFNYSCGIHPSMQGKVVVE